MLERNVTEKIPHIDSILDEVCRELQLSHTQFLSARQKYEAVAQWLSSADHLTQFNPELFVQGSVKLGLSVRPVYRQEFDVDLVFLLNSLISDPMRLYDLVYDRLHSHSTYKPMLERLKRCLRLNYAGEFHLDILPAIPNPIQPGTGILVPDRDLKQWSTSDPKAFANWFNEQSEQRREALLKGVEGFPTEEDVDHKSPLQRAVQLFKRRRDVFFQDEEEAPRSIVLTTLSAVHYCGSRSILESLTSILSRIEQEVASSAGYLRVLNPTNPSEEFSESWAGHPDRYNAFVDFVRKFHQELRAVSEATGYSTLASTLSEMFDTNSGHPVSNAFKNYGRKMNSYRDQKLLRTGGGGIFATSSHAGIRVTKHTNFGD